LGKDIFITPAIHKTNRFICIPFFLIFLSILYASPALGIRLTNVRHLFDITHNFSQPSDVSVSEDGMIYVVDGVNNSIKVFGHTGRHLFSFGRKGDRRGEFLYPLGIDIDSTGKVYIADTGNRRIQVFSPQGIFFIDESRNRCYVVDNNNHNILVYDLSSLEMLNTYGSPGTEKLEFRYPFLITLDKYQYLYIVDVINTRVQLLSPDGLFVNTIGGWGVEKGEFFRPKGVAIDRNNRAYVSDSYMGVIQVFDSSGEFYSVLGHHKTGKIHKFRTPTGIFIDSNNRLYVVEMFAEKVSVYDIEDDPE
jgi:DNA-binding beta-propeller fold protein YncE